MSIAPVALSCMHTMPCVMRKTVQVFLRVCRRVGEGRSRVDSLHLMVVLHPGLVLFSSTLYSYFVQKQCSVRVSV